MPDQTWSKIKLVELIEKHVGPTEKLWKAKKSTLIKILHQLERGPIEAPKLSDICRRGDNYCIEAFKADTAQKSQSEG